MNITKNQKDDLNLSIIINVTPEDYTPRVDKVIREYKQKANMPGFRPGKVPTGLIKKMYGKHITVEEINKILSEELSKYITENKINVLGEPLPSESDQKEIDWENDTTFEFSFDLGLSPEFEIKLSEALKIPYYTIEPDQEMISKQIEDYARRLGSYSEVSSIEGDVLVHGNFTEVDESGKPVENGLTTEDGSFLTQVIKSEDIKKSLTGLKPEDKVKININEAFPNQADVASMLKTDKNNLSEMSSYFEFMISKISKFRA